MNIFTLTMQIIKKKRRNGKKLSTASASELKYYNSWNKTNLEVELVNICIFINFGFEKHIY